MNEVFLDTVGMIAVWNKQDQWHTDAEAVYQEGKGDSTMTKTLHGKIHGRTIELDDDPGVAEGQEVEVEIKVVPPTRKWGEGILRTAGALANDTEWDAIMEEVHRSRKIERRPQMEDE